MKHVATWIRAVDETWFAKVFASYPDVRVWNARIEPVDWKIIGGLLLTGGSDISADFLRQEIPDPSLIEDADPVRDAWEFTALPRALEQRLPLLAICRGLQVLNVHLGGTLILDIPHHDDAKYENSQALRYAEGARYQFPRVNSSHHQALAQLGRGMEVEAWSTEDNIIEQAHLSGYPFALAVQYHPERDPLYRPLFDAFVQEVR